MVMEFHLHETFVSCLCFFADIIGNYFFGAWSMEFWLFEICTTHYTNPPAFWCLLLHIQQCIATAS